MEGEEREQRGQGAWEVTPGKPGSVASCRGGPRPGLYQALCVTPSLGLPFLSPECPGDPVIGKQRLVITTSFLLKKKKKSHFSVWRAGLREEGAEASPLLPGRIAPLRFRPAPPPPPVLYNCHAHTLPCPQPQRSTAIPRREAASLRPRCPPHPPPTLPAVPGSGQLALPPHKRALAAAAAASRGSHRAR